MAPFTFLRSLSEAEYRSEAKSCQLSFAEVNPETMKNHIEIGALYREHGLKGLCKVYIYSQSDENLEVGQDYILESETGKTMNAKILGISYIQKFFLIDFDCFTGGDQVVAWRKAKLWIHEDALQKEDGEMYDFEWKGITILDTNQKTVGVIQDIEHNPLPQFVVDCAGRSVLIPWVDGWIVEHNEELKTIVMDLPEGLLDLDVKETEVQGETEIEDK